MKGFAEQLRVRGDKVRISAWDPRSTPGAKDKAAAEPVIARNLERIDTLQYSLYAEAQRSLLIVLQGMDTSGKDGLVRKVMTAFNPQTCRVWPFKVPTSEEAAHDFLWRIHQKAPGKGNVTIFNRSHYEDVLVVRVHDLVPRAMWSKRYDVINQFERLLVDHGTRVIKFFLHISREEQRERLLERLDEKEKHWKFNEGDLAERALWREYQRAYEDALSKCSPDHAPWYVIPADRKWYRDLAVSQIVADAMEEMDPQPPKVKLNLRALRAKLESG